jgi:hypothetical protein
MKTKILSIIALFILISGISIPAKAATADYVLLNDVKTINKIEVYGNVELFISTDPTGQVKVYNKYYSENALVQNNKGVLRITSYTAEKLVVWVSLNDLRSVSAYDNAEIRTFGDLSAIELNVDLHNTASAKLSLNAYSANVNLKDNAKIELSGNATHLNVNHSVGSTVNSYSFEAEHYTDNRIVMPIAAKNNVLSILE